jgi:serine/threonine protein kinase
VGLPSEESQRPRNTYPWEEEYATIKKINEGGFGAVFHVRSHRTGESFALKTPRTDDDEVQGRFRREMDEQSKLKHRHVMPISDWDFELRWFCMPMADATLAMRAPQMNEDALITAIDHVAQGLAFAHAQGNVHRDVKPQNILLLSTGEEGRRWVISDFGLVRRPKGQTTIARTRGGLGTEGYIAPEVLANPQKADHRADIYSLGRTIMYASTGVVPEQNQPSVASPPWFPLVQAMTETNVEDRIPSMEDVRQELAAVRQRVIDKRVAEWKSQSRSDELVDDELRVLGAILHALKVPEMADEDMATFADIDKLSTNLTRGAVRLGLESLLRRGFVARVPGWSGHYCVTDDGWKWMLSNRERLPIRATGWGDE